MSTAVPARPRRVRPVMRSESARATPLELFFDLVFVLALTQCTALMADQPTFAGLAKGLLVLGLLWWAWTGFTWLTSVIDPDEGGVRLVMFAAMAAMLVVALAVPTAFGDDSLVFAVAYGVFRASQIGLFRIASAEDPGLRTSVNGLAVSTALGVGIVVLAAAFTGGELLVALWGLALVLDVAGPFVFGSEGWKVAPGHFAERHALILIVALGESIVAIGIGAEDVVVDLGVVAAATLGIVIVSSLWWLYFDVVARVAEHRLVDAAPGRAQNRIARDSYSYLHFPMIAGIVLLALALKKTLGDVGEPLKLVPAVALLGGIALYLLAHVAFRLRNVGTLAPHRLAAALVLLALIPAATALPALAAVALAAAVLAALITYEALRFAEARDRVRHGTATSPA